MIKEKWGKTYESYCENTYISNGIMYSGLINTKCNTPYNYD